MKTFIVTLIILLLFVIAMSVGVLFGRKPLKGSCGGVGKALGEEDYVCDVCGGDPEKCDAGEQKSQAGNAESLPYDATRNS